MCCIEWTMILSVRKTSKQWCRIQGSMSTERSLSQVTDGGISENRILGSTLDLWENLGRWQDHRKVYSQCLLLVWIGRTSFKNNVQGRVKMRRLSREDCKWDEKMKWNKGLLRIFYHFPFLKIIRHKNGDRKWFMIIWASKFCSLSTNTSMFHTGWVSNYSIFWSKKLMIPYCMILASLFDGTSRYENEACVCESGIFWHFLILVRSSIRELEISFANSWIEPPWGGGWRIGEGFCWLHCWSFHLIHFKNSKFWRNRWRRYNHMLLRESRRRWAAEDDCWTTATDECSGLSVCTWCLLYTKLNLIAIWFDTPQNIIFIK